MPSYRVSFRDALSGLWWALPPVVRGTVHIGRMLSALKGFVSSLASAVVSVTGTAVVGQWLEVWGNLHPVAQTLFGLASFLAFMAVLAHLVGRIKARQIDETTRRERLADLYWEHAKPAYDAVLGLLDDRIPRKASHHRDERISSHLPLTLSGTVIAPLKEHRVRLEDSLDNRSVSSDKVVEKFTVFYQYYYRALWWLHGVAGFVGVDWDGQSYQSMREKHRDFKKSIRRLSYEPGYRDLASIPETVNRERKISVDKWGVEYDG